MNRDTIRDIQEYCETPEGKKWFLKTYRKALEYEQWCKGDEQE